MIREQGKLDLLDARPGAIYGGDHVLSTTRSKTGPAKNFLNGLDNPLLTGFSGVVVLFFLGREKSANALMMMQVDQLDTM